MAPFFFLDTPMSKLTGPWILGFMWSHLLYGILIVQIYIYGVHFPKDPVGIKLTVALLFFVETLFTIFCNFLAFKTLGSGWGDTDVLISLDWSWLTTPFLTGITELIVQSFYVWRIWRLTKKAWICIIIESISLLSVTSTFYYGGKFVQAPFIASVVDQNTPIVIWLAAAAACDVLITFTMVIHLQQAKKDSAYGHTTALLNRLLTWTVETGMLTAVMAVIELSLWVASPQFNYHVVWYLTIARLYANALLATLNSRALIRLDRTGGSTKSETAFVVAGNSGLWTDAQAGIDSNPGKVHKPNLALTVTTEEHTMYSDRSGADPKALELSVFRDRP